MARNFSKFNSARSKADFNQASNLGMVIVSNNSAAALAHADVNGATNWATANTNINIALLAANIYGDGASWASVSGGTNLTLAAGTYEYHWNISCRATTIATSIYWAITNAAFTSFIAESLVSQPLSITVDEDSAVINSMGQFTLSAETALALHVGVASTKTAYLAKGDFGQIIFKKVA